MYEPEESGPAPLGGSPEAHRAVAWLKDSGAVEHTLHTSLGGLPSERDVTLARMGAVLQATAQGLGSPAAAVWAGVPEQVLRGWIDEDPAFASALYAARALASAHDVKPGGGQHAPAMLRVLLVAIGNGATTLDALKLADFRERRFRTLLNASSGLRALVEAARRARPARTHGTYVPGSYRPRRPGRKPAAPLGFRLVRRDAPDAPESGGR
ncbi:hypothetical protein ACFRJ7_30530 [Streptomyces sp. NPDC056747]|uniref:hypothetical protein n=1 Tax=Streptomyces sp. NPDC056747 TaxID=3345935 RepID=UPI0036C228BA